MGQTVIIDLDRVHSIYHASFSEHSEKNVQMALMHPADSLGQDVHQIASFGQMITTICGDWPLIKSTINSLLRYAGWMPIPGIAGTVAMAQAFMKALDGAIMPAICAAGASGGTVSGDPVPKTPGYTSPHDKTGR